MEILKLKVMRGPNCWSDIHQQLIVVKINLNEPLIPITGEIINTLKELRMPSSLLYEGIPITQLTGHIAVAMQRMAGMECAYITEQPSILHNEPCIIFTYQLEAAGTFAASAAVELINSIQHQTPFNIDAAIGQLSRLNRRQGLGPSTKAIADAAKERGIPVTRLDDDSLLMLGHGANQRLIRAAVADSTSAIAVELAQDKDRTKKLLDASYVPIPPGVIVNELEELVAAIDDIGFPLVIKPSDGNHGRGITTMIQSQTAAVKAFQVAQQISDDVIVEKHIQGDDYRFLVINYQLVAAAKRTPAMVTGDGISTIAQLIEEINKDPRRGSGHQQVLTSITADEDTLAILAIQSLTMDSVLSEGRSVYLKSTANLSTGGTAEDVTDLVHPDNKAIAERISRLMNLDICGIDIMSASVSEPITDVGGAVLEVNAGPGLRMHLAPSIGKARNVAAPIVDMLFPPGTPATITLVAVTGTNGKTTTTRLIAHLAKEAGYHPGFTTTDGIYIGNRLVSTGDCSGPQSAKVVLRDPLVDFAVLECARGGILRSGLGFEQCGVAIVTNISSDHLGIDGIDTLDKLARVKAVVPKSVATTGCAILNADDDLVYRMKDDVSGQIALFSKRADNTRIDAHINAGELVVYIEDDWFVLGNNHEKQHILPVADVPLTFNGTATAMIENILPAIATAFVQRFSLQQIRNGLRSFKPSVENTPGRMNQFDFCNFRLMVDYAHNEGGYQELKKYAAQVTASVKTGIIAATGDRRDQDICSLGALAAEIFDELIIRHDKDSRGRTDENITGLLLEGIRKVKPQMPVNVISDEIEAIGHAISQAKKDAWIFIGTDNVPESLAYISRTHRDHLLHQSKNDVAA